MFGKWTFITSVLGVAAAILGLGLVPGISDAVQTMSIVVFFILLFLFIFSLFDVVGEAFRRE
jgi:hypothetical protein